MDVLRRHHAASPASQGRKLLRKLRDLNLSLRGVAIEADRAVDIEGCLSLDGPVEQGVRYRLRLADGAERVLALSWTEGELEITVSEGAEIERRLTASLAEDPNGRLTSLDLVARLDPESTEPREFEHFLRRIVRGALSAA